MIVRVWKVFGREFLRVETHQETTLADMVTTLMTQKMQQSGVVECACCGEEFDPSDCDDDDDDEITNRFIEMTNKIVWDAVAKDEDEDS